MCGVAILSMQRSEPAGTLLPTTKGAEPSIAVIILTYNEARHLARAIASVRSFATDVLVVDSFSTDATVEIARAAGARVLQNPFVNQSRQFQWALDQGGIASDWILRLDADEVIEDDLVREIGERLPRFGAEIVGVNFLRKHVFMGRWIRHGGRYPLALLRLFRAGHGRVEQRWMDEHIVVWGGATATMRGGFADICLHDLTFFIDKHNRYATREAIEILNGRYRLFGSDAAFSAAATSRQAGTKRWIKERIYNRLPFWAGPLGYFLYRYVVQLGVLDGRAGLIYHFLQGFWYRFLVNAKVVEYERALAGCATADARRERLSALTGHAL
jgi:glycosyltransferase involved in cell wall biosynthesis